MFGAEGLYWTTSQTNLDYATDVDGGKKHSLHYQWQPGVRGWWGLHCLCGEGRFVYTWLNTEAKGSAVGDSLDPLNPSLLQPDVDSPEALVAKAHNSLDYQTLDMLFGYNFSYYCDALWVHPYFGVRGMQILQQFKVNYEGLDFVEPSLVKIHSTLKAAGINGGLDVQYTLVNRFGMYGGFSGSILAGSIHSRQKQQTRSGSTFDTDFRFNDKTSVWVPGYQLTAGLSWRAHCRYFYDLLITVGYEFSQWYRVPTTHHIQNEVNDGFRKSITKGNLILQGVTASVFIAF